MAIFNSYVKLPEGIVDLPIDIHITYLNWRYLPYIFGLFLRPNFQGISPQNMAKNMVRTYLHWFKSGFGTWAPEHPIQCEAPKISKLVYNFITPITMVYGTYNYRYWGESKPTNITGGPHIVWVIHNPHILETVETLETLHNCWWIHLQNWALWKDTFRTQP